MFFACDYNFTGTVPAYTLEGPSFEINIYYYPTSPIPSNAPGISGLELKTGIIPIDLQYQNAYLFLNILISNLYK